MRNALSIVVYRTIPTSNHNPVKEKHNYKYVVYRTIPTSNHNPLSFVVTMIFVVYRTIPTSNHNNKGVVLGIVCVVYRTIPTSNHNKIKCFDIISLLYIVLFLHQTTTSTSTTTHTSSCISYYSYIKPQPKRLSYARLFVVYRTIPTSNHNSSTATVTDTSLYIVLFLHQTTTP